MKIPAMRMLLPIFSKSSRKNTGSYLATKIQVQKIESAHYSLHFVKCVQIRIIFGPYPHTFHAVLNILKLLNSIAFDFSESRKSRQKVENSMVLSDMLNSYTFDSL